MGEIERAYNDEELIEQAKKFLEGKAFFVDTFYSKKLKEDYKVICYTVGDRPDFIKATNLMNLISQNVYLSPKLWPKK